MKFFNDTHIDKIRKGYYSAVYFNRTKYILLKEKNFQNVTMQIFQKNDNVNLCGIAEVIELLRFGTGYWKNDKWVDKSDKITVKALQDGDRVTSRESIMHITGPYVYFAHLESLYLGILARRTNIATNAQQVLSVTNKPILFFGDRFDSFLNQEGDGYAAHIGGITSVATEAQSFLWQGQVVGTMPHSLIAVHQGNTLQAAKAFIKYYPNIPLVVLVDFDNDCVTTSLQVARALGKRLWGIRLDTSESLVDKSLQDYKKEKKFYGVNPTLVKNIRKSLNNAQFGHVKIVVSGGFDKEKIALFENEQTPVDFYGVGSWLLKGTNPFTADTVRVGNKHIAKAGRKYKKNPRMKNIYLDRIS